MEPASFYGLGQEIDVALLLPPLMITVTEQRASLMQGMGHGLVSGVSQNFLHL